MLAEFMLSSLHDRPLLQLRISHDAEPMRIYLTQEDSFHLVDTRPTQRNRGGPRRFGPNRFQQAQRQREAEAAAAESKHRQPRKKQQARMIHQYQRSDQRVRLAAVQLSYTCIPAGPQTGVVLPLRPISGSIIWHNP